MRMLLIFVFGLLISSAIQAQVFAVDTLLKNGSISDRINLVFLGDGYTAGEQGKFITDVNEILDAMFAQSPFKEYKSYFNVYAVKVISVESGANHPKTSSDSDCTTPVAVVNNYFGSMFDYAGIHRLLYPTKPSVVAKVLVDNFPLYDQAFVAVNSPYYGGAGGTFATCSDNANGREVALHEIGHSLAGLADEYWAGPQYAVEKPNMTQQTSPSLVKWKSWMGVNGVGIYSHSGDASWKKPHTNCKMEKLNVPFCKVCSETFVERFHAYVRPLSDFSPSDEQIQIDPEIEQNLEFSLSLVPPAPNTLKITWEKNNVVISKNVDGITVSSVEMGTMTTIRATVQDTIDLTRSESHAANHFYVVEWDVFKGDAITGTETNARQFDIAVFPNPAESNLRLKYTLSKPVPVAISLMDTNGNKIVTLLKEDQEVGAYEYEFDRAKLNIAPGAYTVQFMFGKTSLPVKVLIR